MNEVNIDVLSGLFSAHEKPEIKSVEIDANSALIQMHVPESLSWFKGHFPQQAVLPGVVQIDWAGKFSKAIFSQLGSFQQVTNVKFKTMVMPKSGLTLALEFNPAKSNITFQYSHEDTSFSSGVFKFSSQ